MADEKDESPHKTTPQQPTPLPEHGQTPVPPPGVIPGVVLQPGQALPGVVLQPPYAVASPVVLPIQTVQAQQTLQVWQSPYPPPEAIERFEKVQPGSFDRILRMVENLQQAQIHQARMATEYAHSDTKRGQWLGFALGVIACVGSVTCLALGNPWVAASF
jgi:hypothetical protein